MSEVDYLTDEALIAVLRDILQVMKQRGEGYQIHHDALDMAIRRLLPSTLAQKPVDAGKDGE